MRQMRFGITLMAMGLIALGVACSDDTTDPTGPATPTNVAVAQLSLTSVRVTWTAATGAETYVLERASAANPGVFAAVSDTITGTQYDDTGLTAGVAYSYRVSAEADGVASDPSTVVTVTTGTATATLSGDITANRTLYTDTVYTLSGYVKVKNGATLTIQPGTKIVGDAAVLGSSLWITRGAQINAVGTADAPIVFTSGKEPGSRKPGDWGGIIIVGNGVINRTTSPINTEGPGNVAEDYSGGNDNASTSGTLKYVRIEFAGYDVSNGGGQELNSLSMYAVGSGTTIEYVQSMSGLDDSFEFWGGAARGKYLISYEAGDDHFDWSEGYVGHLQYLIAFQSQQLQPAPNAGTVSGDPRGFEADGCDPGVAGCVITNAPYSNPTISNFTLVGTGALAGFPNDGNGIVLRRGTAGFLFNGIVTRYKGTGCQMRDSFTDTQRVNGELVISNVIFGNNGANYDNTGADTTGSAARFCQVGDWSTNNHRTNVVAAAELFASLNPASLDFSPAAGQLADTMTVTIALPAARLGGYLDNTTFVGASDGAKWWQTWSTYVIN